MLKSLLFVVILNLMMLEFANIINRKMAVRMHSYLGGESGYIDSDYTDSLNSDEENNNYEENNPNLQYGLVLPLERDSFYDFVTPDDLKFYHLTEQQDVIKLFQQRGFNNKIESPYHVNEKNLVVMNDEDVNLSEVTGTGPVLLTYTTTYETKNGTLWRIFESNGVVSAILIKAESEDRFLSYLYENRLGYRFIVSDVGVFVVGSEKGILRFFEPDIIGHKISPDDGANESKKPYYVIAKAPDLVTASYLESISNEDSLKKICDDYVAKWKDNKTEGRLLWNEVYQTTNSVPSHVRTKDKLFDIIDKEKKSNE